ncbi:MAG: hypothetical protein EP297_13165 [Gammaproteobacteria bacterium]|nr:MAG: hypothetical protein EP297_13165 [Gammaproteobacteria bacterium]
MTSLIRNVVLMLVLLMPQTGVYATVKPAAIQTFANQLVDSVNRKEPEYFSESIDKAMLSERILADMELPAKQKEDLAAKLIEGITTVPARLFKQMQEGDYWSVKKHYKTTDGERLLIRINRSGLGVSFMEFHVKADHEGQYRILDWFNYATGRLYSETAREVVPMVQSGQRNLLEKVFRIDRSRRKVLDTMHRINKYAQKNNYKKALQLYFELPEDVATRRQLLLYRILLARQVNDDEYRKALATLAQYHGADASLALMLMGHYVFTQNWQNAHKAVDNLIQQLGEDAALYDLQGNIYVLEGKTNEAEVACLRSIELEPEYVKPYWTLVMVYLGSKDYEKVAGTLKQLSDTFHYQFDPDKLVASEPYVDFGKSDAFRKWRNDMLSR